MDTDARKQLDKRNNKLAELAPLINILQRLMEVQRDRYPYRLRLYATALAFVVTSTRD